MKLNRASLGIAAFAAAGALAIACGGDDSASAPIDTLDAGGDGAVNKDGGTPTGTDSGMPDTSVVDAAADAAADANRGTNLDGGACDGGAVTVTGVTPRFGTTTDKTPITVSGTGFVATPKI